MESVRHLWQTTHNIYHLILRAAEYLIRQGPATQQERWEENSGYSPSTLAACIAALICAACIVREHGDENTARFIEEYADFLECHIEAWTVTTEGTLVPDIKQHYIRITPADPSSPHPKEDPNQGTVNLTSRPPNEKSAFPAKEFDLIPEVAERYLGQRQKCKSLSVWKFNRQVEKIELGQTLRIQATAPFRLHWTQDDWQKSEDTPSSSTALAIYYVDLPLSENKATSIEFTFFWSDSNSWEGRNYQVAVKSD